VTANRVLVISRHAIQGEAMRKFYRYLKRLGTVAGAVRQIVLTVLLICSVTHNPIINGDEQTPVRNDTTRI
jgi:hypothetical protein